MERLKELRKQHGYTQLELANKIGIAKNTIASYEQGHRSIPVTTAVKLSKVLNTHWTIFFEDEVRETYDKKEA